MKLFKRYLTAALALVMVAAVAAPVFADAAEGDVILSFGQDLTKAQREDLRKRFNAGETDQVIEVTNAEEHKYLGDFLPAAKIGSKAISSAKIEYTKAGSGIRVETSDRIRYITDDMYRQALETAGVEDADITVDAPMNVSGTAALTGIMKAYEETSGKKISEDVKKAANEEMVVTSDLADEVGADKATDVVKDIKEKIATEAPKSREEVQNIIINVSNEYNLNLSEAQKEDLTDFFDRLRTTKIDWNGLADKAKGAANQAKDYLGSEEGQGFLMSIKAGFGRFIDWFASLFR
ncbi:MAG: DUF1002 domain-containing protein [Peptoniphilus sp.]|nr:DUF1002 domain-containing protein [Peptoniphilus sp.]MDD7362596.1 DUF1002 domain-containing protein [Bacillota bacterium]MDY6045005.1 DUF1002 domain-containing protein [Peptoniphilus sp.]